jgi:hypothetical protein
MTLMTWKPPGWVKCLLPLLSGCVTHDGTPATPGESPSSPSHPLLSVSSDLGWAQTSSGTVRDPRQDASSAWWDVRVQFPQRPFTDDFRDGFLDGYAGSVERGGAAAPPSVPPVKYIRLKTYCTPAGHCQLRDYYLGFRYGVEVAAARRAPTGPAKPARPNSDQLPPLPVPELPGGNKSDAPKRSDDPPSSGADGNRSIPPLPKPELPVIKPFNPDLSSGVPIPPTGSSRVPLSVPVEEPPTVSPRTPLPLPPLPEPNIVAIPAVPTPEPQTVVLPAPPEVPKGTLPLVLELFPYRGPVVRPWIVDEVSGPAPDSLPAVLSVLPVIPARPAPAAPDEATPPAK